MRNSQSMRKVNSLIRDNRYIITPFTSVNQIKRLIKKLTFSRGFI